MVLCTWCCELAVHVAETGCWCRAVVLVVGAGWVLVRELGAGCARGGDRLLVPGGGAGGGCWLGIGAGVVSWLCTWWRQVVGADGDRLLVAAPGRRGDRLLVPVV